MGGKVHSLYYLLVTDLWSQHWPHGGKSPQLVLFIIAAREHLPLRLSVAHPAIDHPPLGHLLLTFDWVSRAECQRINTYLVRTL